MCLLCAWDTSCTADALQSCFNASMIMNYDSASKVGVPLANCVHSLPFHSAIPFHVHNLFIALHRFHLVRVCSRFHLHNFHF